MNKKQKEAFATIILIILVSILAGLKCETPIEAILIGILIYLCIKISKHDINTYTIEDKDIIFGTVIWIVLSLIRVCINNFTIKMMIRRVIFSIILTLLLTVVTVITEKITKKEMFGGGDIKLLFMLGLYFKIEKTLVALFLASLISLIYTLIKNRKKNIKEIPFAPFICIGFLIMFIF